MPAVPALKRGPRLIGFSFELEADGFAARVRPSRGLGPPGAAPLTRCLADRIRTAEFSRAAVPGPGHAVYWVLSPSSRASVRPVPPPEPLLDAVLRCGLTAAADEEPELVLHALLGSGGTVWSAAVEHSAVPRATEACAMRALKRIGVADGAAETTRLELERAR